jgi:uncharacterized iron-regulated membrane protein
MLAMIVLGALLAAAIVSARVLWKRRKREDRRARRALLNAEAARKWQEMQDERRQEQGQR